VRSSLVCELRSRAFAWLIENPSRSTFGHNHSICRENSKNFFNFSDPGPTSVTSILLSDSADELEELSQSELPAKATDVSNDLL